MTIEREAGESPLDPNAQGAAETPKSRGRKAQVRGRHGANAKSKMRTSSFSARQMPTSIVSAPCLGKVS